MSRGTEKRGHDRNLRFDVNEPNSRSTREAFWLLRLPRKIEKKQTSPRATVCFIYFILYIHVDKHDSSRAAAASPSASQASRGEGATKQRMTRNARDRYSFGSVVGGMGGGGVW